jgi:hypothetical protein
MTQIYVPPRPDNRRKRWTPLAVLAGTIITAGIIATVVLTTSSDDTEQRGPAGNEQILFAATAPLADAAATCTAGTLANDDHTLVVDMAGEELGTGEATIDDVLCVLAELEAPQAILAQMESTRALDGMQSATWSTYEVTWNYHPDDGLDLIITTLS